MKISKNIFHFYKCFFIFYNKMSQLIKSIYARLLKILFFSQKTHFSQKSIFDIFYGNDRVTRIENHYAYGNEKTQMFSSYYQALHDNITKRFL